MAFVLTGFLVELDCINLQKLGLNVSLRARVPGTNPRAVAYTDQVLQGCLPVLLRLFDPRRGHFQPDKSPAPAQEPNKPDLPSPVPLAVRQDVPDVAGFQFLADCTHVRPTHHVLLGCGAPDLHRLLPDHL